MKFTTAKQTEQAAFEQVRLKPFTKIHGRPTRRDRNTLREEICVAASEVDMPFAEAGEFGLLGEIMDADEYTAVTDGLVYAAPTEPEAYDENIDNDMEDHERKKLEALHDERLEAWYTRRGALRALCDNVRDALDEKYYQSLKKPIIAYKKVPVKEYINHLDEKWCKLDTRETKKLKKHYYRGWEIDHEEHIEEFIKRLNEEQISLGRDKVVISNDDKLQHFLEEMYDCGMFDRRDYKEWETKEDDDKTWEAATAHFTEIVDNMDTYNHNIGGSAKKAKYESAMHVDEAATVEEQRDDAALQHFLEQTSQKDEHIQAMTANQTSLVAMQGEMQTMIMNMQRQMQEQSQQMAALKQQLSKQPRQERRASTPVKNNTPIKQEASDDEVVKTKCTFCNKTHGPICFKDPKNADKVPQWFKDGDHIAMARMKRKNNKQKS
jgi:hypothetical protein